jgi:hypothetical protein
VWRLLASRHHLPRRRRLGRVSHPPDRAMRKKRLLSAVREKVKRDEALNLTELAIYTCYDRGVLGDMLLPLQGGKIFYTDFRRIIATRQDRHEHSLASITPLLHHSISPAKRSAAASPEEATPTKIIADKFRAPKWKGVRRAASHVPAGSRPRNTELQRKLA